VRRNKLKPDLRLIAKSIDKSQSEAIQVRATSGQVRSFELTWVTRLVQIHNFRIVPAFTGKQRQNLRDLISRLGSVEALSLLNYSIKKWVSIKMIYPFLPPRPVFDSFYFHRDKFLAFMIEEGERNKKSAEAVERIKLIERIPTPMANDKISLVEMFKKARDNGKGIT
jgi:hypothetical protein